MSEPIEKQIHQLCADYCGRRIGLDDYRRQRRILLDRLQGIDESGQGHTAPVGEDTTVPRPVPTESARRRDSLTTGEGRHRKQLFWASVATGVLVMVLLGIALL